MKTETTEPSDGDLEQLAEDWEHRISLAEKKLVEEAGEISRDRAQNTKWQGLINFYRGQQWLPGQGGQEETFDRITANQAKSNIDSIRPQLYFRNPRVIIGLKNPQLAQSDIPFIGPDGQPVMRSAQLQGQTIPIPVVKIKKGTPIATIGGEVVDARQQVELLTAVDQYTLDENKAEKKIRQIVNDALILPYGVAKWEWVVETSEKTRIGIKNGESVEETYESVDRQYARLSRVQPWRFIWDSELDEFDLDLASWVAEIKYLSEDDIENDKSLTNTESLPDPSYYVGDDDTTNNARTLDSDKRARYKTYEIHDLKHGEFLVWIEGSDKINRLDSPSPYEAVEGSIYTVLGFNDVPDDSFPLSSIDIIKSKAQALNKIISYQVNHVARFNRKYATTPNNLNPDEREKFERGDDGTIVEAKDPAAIIPIQDAQVSPDMYNVAGILKREITEDIGVSAYSRSSREPGVDTAYEANLIQGGSDIKTQEKRDIVRLFCIDLIRKLNQILKVHADTESVIEIVGEKGSQWKSWTKDSIQGEFIEDVDIQSSMPASEELEKKQAMEMYSLTAADPYFNPFKVRQQVVRVFKWPEDLLYSPEEFNRIMQQQQQQAQQQAAVEENRKQQSQTLRPSQGQESTRVQRGPDRLAAVKGQARNSR